MEVKKPNGSAGRRVCERLRHFYSLFFFYFPVLKKYLCDFVAAEAALYRTVKKIQQ